MQLEFRSKGIKITEEIKNYVEKRFSKLDKFTTRPLLGKVMFKSENKEAKVEVTINVGQIIIRAEKASKELNDAIDFVSDKLEKQIKNNKHKLVRSLQEKSGIKDLFIDTPEVEKMVNSAVKIKQYKLEVLNFDEAVTQMELLDHDFFVFKNDKDQVCVVYLRNDGEYGLIETF